ncbi:MAG TPA: hypothetical protein VHE55_16965 [Fimbriimonadaceae bacterium]|nr:hypothetical protein [Fimbriimonadaceae bacterium]
MARWLVLVLVAAAAFGCGRGEITVQDQANKSSKLDAVAKKNPNNVGFER